MSVMAKAPRLVQAPRAVGTIMQSDWKITNGSRRGSIRVKGRDWLCRISASASEAPGYVYVEVYINPLELAGTRLSLFAQLFDKYRFDDLTFHFTPAGSTTTRGSLILAYDRDISDATPPVNDMGVRQFLSMLDAVSGPMWAPLQARCPLSHPEEGLFTNPVAGGDDRLSYQGQLYIACMEPSSLTAGWSIGDVFVDYDVEFFDPQLDTTVPITRTTSSGGAFSAGVLAQDALRSYAPGGNATISSGTGPRSLVPVVGPDLISYINLAQGVYRLTNSIVQTTAGAINMAAPIIQALVPKAAPAPQPIIRTVTDGPSSADGDTAIYEAIVAVPPGGGKLYQSYTSVSGADADTVGALLVEQMMPVWADPATLY